MCASSVLKVAAHFERIYGRSLENPLSSKPSGISSFFPSVLWLLTLFFLPFQIRGQPPFRKIKILFPSSIQPYLPSIFLTIKIFFPCRIEYPHIYAAMYIKDLLQCVHSNLMLK